MGFREMLKGAIVDEAPISVSFEMRARSLEKGNAPMVFTNVKEAPGHSAAINILDRKRLRRQSGII